MTRHWRASATNRIRLAAQFHPKAAPGPHDSLHLFDDFFQVIEQFRKAPASEPALTLAWRYPRKPTDRIVSAASLVLIHRPGHGVMALMISMALMTGYRQDLERKILGGNPELIPFPVTD